MKLNPGVGYTSVNLGEASGLVIDSNSDSSARNFGRQFECSITGAKVGEAYEYRLHVRKGLVEFDYYGSNDKGIIDLDNLGGFNGTNTQNMFFYVNKFNLFPNGSLTEGTDDKSEFISKNGYIKLESGKNYFVFLYKTTPDWKQSETELFEAKAPQIGIAAEDSEPNIFIKTQRNGGSFLQSYIRLDGGGTFNNVVTADSLTGQIATFNAGELNTYIHFNTQWLDIVRARGTASDTNPHSDQYPPALSYLLGESIPTFLTKSNFPYNINNPLNNGDSISGVPYGENWAKGNEGGGSYVTVGNSPIIIGGTVKSNYANAGDENNYSAENVLIGRDVSAYYTPPKTELNLITGLINVNDFEIVIHQDIHDSTVINFSDSDIKITADNQTSIKTPGEMTDAGTGFVYTDCYRQDIAYIKWNADLNRFQIYQLQYGVIHLRQNPLGSFRNKLLTTSGQIAKWDTGFDLCSLITGTFSGYTKALNSSTSATQPPVYAGYVDIGNYQSPIETI